MLNLGARNKAAFISQIFTGRRLSAKLTEGLLLQISSCNLHLQSSHHLQWSPSFTQGGLSVATRQNDKHKFMF